MERNAECSGRIGRIAYIRAYYCRPHSRDLQERRRGIGITTNDWCIYINNQSTLIAGRGDIGHRSGASAQRDRLNGTAGIIHFTKCTKGNIVTLSVICGGIRVRGGSYRTGSCGITYP